MKGIYRIAGKFGGELNLAHWRIDQSKIRQYLIHVYILRANAICTLDAARADTY